MLIGLVVFFYYWGDISFVNPKIFNTTINIKNPVVVDIFLIATWIYWEIRYFHTYFLFSGKNKFKAMHSAKMNNYRKKRFNKEFKNKIHRKILGIIEKYPGKEIRFSEVIFYLEEYPKFENRKWEYSPLCMIYDKNNSPPNPHQSRYNTSSKRFYSVDDPKPLLRQATTRAEKMAEDRKYEEDYPPIEKFEIKIKFKKKYYLIPILSG